MKAQAGLVLGVLLAAAIAATTTGFVVSEQVHEKLAAFASNSTSVTGQVANRRIYRDSGNWACQLDVKFQTQEGARRQESVHAANTTCDPLTIGGPVQVTYVKSRPEWFYVAKEAPTERDVGIFAGLFEFGLLASFVLTMSLIGLVSWHGTVAAFASEPDMESEPAKPPQRNVVPLRQPLGQARTSFGTRQVRR